MKQIFNIIEIVLSAVLIAAILLQSRGSGLGGVFGGEGNVYRTKRGFEKILFTTTIVVSVIFFGAAIANILFVNK
ncbi:MAG: preprotein translocase subunit SecG [Patescibacteria group bacterium]